MAAAQPAYDAVPGWDEAYGDLKRIARARLHAAGGITHLNTTALVNETFAKWGHRADASAFPSKGHFYAYAAKVMRTLIVDMVRERQAQRRGGGRRARRHPGGTGQPARTHRRARGCRRARCRRPALAE